jgi:DNA mismatch repair protein MSH5
MTRPGVKYLSFGVLPCLRCEAQCKRNISCGILAPGNIRLIWILHRFINKDTLSSLQVIQSESHPNAFNQGPGKTSPGSKESLSIYGLFQRFTRTPQGKTRLRQHFIRPSSEVDVIRKRQDFISVFLRPENEEVLGKLSKSFRGIKNLRPVMVHLRKGVCSGNARFKGVKSVVWATLLEV